MDAKEISKIRSAVEEAQRIAGDGRARFPKDVKEAVMEFLRRGESATEISNLTGLGSSTLYKWSRLAGKKTRRFRRVKVKAETPRPEPKCDFKITLPSGILIECTSVSLLKEILSLVK